MCFSKNSGRLSSAGPESFRLPLLGELLTDFGLLYTNFKLKYEDLENVKLDRVNTVVFNVYQIKHRAFFGTPGSTRNSSFSLGNCPWKLRVAFNV